MSLKDLDSKLRLTQKVKLSLREITEGSAANMANKREWLPPEPENEFSMNTYLICSMGISLLLVLALWMAR